MERKLECCGEQSLPKNERAGDPVPMRPHGRPRLDRVPGEAQLSMELPGGGLAMQHRVLCHPKGDSRLESMLQETDQHAICRSGVLQTFRHLHGRNASQSPGAECKESCIYRRCVYCEPKRHRCKFTCGTASLASILETERETSAHTDTAGKPQHHERPYQSKRDAHASDCTEYEVRSRKARSLLAA